MTNFTPNDERRLREAAEKARAGCGSGYFLLDKYELDDADSVAYYRDAANSVPALLALKDELLKVVRAADKTRECRWEHLDTQPPFDDLWHVLDEFSSSPHAIWLQPEGKEEGDAND